jgi:hypothetical protein
MTDPAGERAPRRRGRPSAGQAGDARAPSRTAGGSTREDSPGSGRAPGRPAKGTRARTPTADADEPRQTGKPTRKPAKPNGKPTTDAKPGRDRPDQVRGAGGRWPMADRSVLPTVLGVPPIAAVGLAAALTAIGVLVDLTRIGNLSTVFTICHISGCVLAVIWVRRNGLFGPMVQPPLLVAAAVPVVVLMAGSPRPGQGVADQLLVIGAPLVNAFPVMAWTTGIVLVIGLLRIVLQRPVSGPSERDAAREAART